MCFGVFWVGSDRFQRVGGGGGLGGFRVLRGYEFDVFGAF